jgi:hypothetical protein
MNLLNILLISLIFFSGCIEKKDVEIYKYRKIVPVQVVEYNIFLDINRIRVKEGLPPYELDPYLSEVARDYAIQMFRTNLIGHIDIYNRSHNDRLLNKSFVYFYSMENIFYKSEFCDNEEKIIASALEGWMKSAGHRETILNKHSKKMGVGYYCSNNKAYVVLLVGNDCIENNYKIIPNVEYRISDLLPDPKVPYIKAFQITSNKSCSIVEFYVFDKEHTDPISANIKEGKIFFRYLPISIIIRSPFNCNVDLKICARNDIISEN